LLKLPSKQVTWQDKWFQTSSLTEFSPSPVDYAFPNIYLYKERNQL
jgi:hypothetical protein